MRTPNVILCNRASPCDCLDNDVFRGWYSDACGTSSITNSTAVNATANNSSTPIESAVFENVDAVSIFLALCTGIVMVAIIFLSVLYSRYRRRQTEIKMAKFRRETNEKIINKQRRELDCLQQHFRATKDELNSIDFAFENFERDEGVASVPFSSLKKNRDLGAGAFGEVYSANWYLDNGERVEVAVKEMHRQHLTRSVGFGSVFTTFLKF